MIFANSEISIEDLPQADAVTWLDMDKNFTRRLLAQSFLTLLVIAVGIAALQFLFVGVLADNDLDISVGWLWLLLLVWMLPLIAWPLISVPKLGYAVRDKDIVYKSGVFWRTVTAIPFNRIQHVEKSSTPLDRRFNIATLQLFTAGGTGGDLKIHGLPTDTAETLRIFILNKVGASIEHR